MDGKRRGAGGERKREKNRHRERGGMEGKKIKQIGMQHTTPGGWNEGGVKLGQLGVPAPGERVGSILSLSLSLVFSYTPARTRERARRHASAYMHALPPSLCLFLLFLFSFLLSFIGRLHAAARGKSRNTRRTKRESRERKEREREGGFVAGATCRWIARELGFSRSRSY